VYDIHTYLIPTTPVGPIRRAYTHFSGALRSYPYVSYYCWFQELPAVLIAIFWRGIVAQKSEATE